MSDQHQESNVSNEKLFRLVGSLCNETISSAQHEQLQDLLSNDAAARQLYFQYLDVHLELGKSSGAESPGFPVAAHEKAVSGSDYKKMQRAVKRSSRITSLALVALIAVVIGVPAYFQNINSAQPVKIVVQKNEIDSEQETTHKAVTQGVEEVVQSVKQEKVLASVVQTSHVRFAESEHTLRVGSQLKKSQLYALVEGELQILFASGAEVILKGPAFFKLVDEEILSVDYGACSVYAPPGAEGFIVRTPMTKVVDLGTRFSVNVQEGGETDVQVVEGEAEVFAVHSEASSKQQAIQLTKGSALRFDQSEQSIAQEIKYNQKRYSKQLPDRVVSYAATLGKYGGYDELTNITVQRGGEKYEYQIDELIGIKLVHFKGFANSTCMTTAFDDEDPALDGMSRLANLESDRSIVTGLINPGRSDAPLKTDPVMNVPEMKEQLNTPGMGIRFDVPVVNGPGPDVVLFDLQLIVYPVHGDNFYVSPFHFKPGLRTHRIRNFDINLSSAEALFIDKFKLYKFKNSIESLHDLETTPAPKGSPHGIMAKALAVGIDLSDLGYKQGEEVSELFIQGILGDGSYVDPVFIAGFPEIKQREKSK